MTSSILSIGQSGLAAAQIGLATTGHNVANASTPGYNRQVAEQGALAGQDRGFGFVGRGAETTAVRRVYNEFLSGQVTSTQTTRSRYDAYHAQVRRIDSMLADPETGISPVLQGFFKNVQNVSAAPGSAASRQSLLSSAHSLAASFQNLDHQLSEAGAGVNSEIKASITAVNAYAKQVTRLNDAIEKAQANTNGKMANDLLDQRDQVIADLAKEIKVSVVKQGESYNVFIGNGQPLVLNTTAFALAPIASATDPERIQVGYVAGSETVPLPDSTISGGRLGGLLEFRSGTLDVTQNALGRIAIGLTSSFNAQHRLGQTQSNMMGGDFFQAGKPVVAASRTNTGNGVVAAAITNPEALTVSDYWLRFDGSNYSLTRVTDGSVATFASLPHTIDGVTVDLTAGNPAAGDSFLIRPTAAGARGFGVGITDKADIAVAAPIVTAAPRSNIGTGMISPGAVTTGFNPSTVASPITITYDSGTLAGFPGDLEVTVTENGVDKTYPAGAAVPYVPGATIRFGGIEIQLSGAPGNGDAFTIARNSSGEGDNRNAMLLGKLQEANTIAGGTTSYQGAYAQLVNMVGNKTREMEVSSTGAAKMYAQAVLAQQSVSGVNLDEEAANLVRYQQAYQAAGKVMQIAAELFDTVLQLGR